MPVDSVFDHPFSRAAIAEALQTIPEGKRAAVIVSADAQGNAVATFAAKYGEHWKLAAGATYYLGETRPSGYVGIEGSW